MMGAGCGVVGGRTVLPKAEQLGELRWGAEDLGANGEESALCDTAKVCEL